MIVDGRAIAEEMKAALTEKMSALVESEKPTLFIIAAGENAATKSFVGVKKKFAAAVGISVEELFFNEKEASTAALIGAIEKIAARGAKGGIVVQLPLLVSVDTDAVLNAIPLRLDVDVLGEEAGRLFREGKPGLLPPVVGAIREILERASVFLHGKKVVILGRGRLVGAPAALWFPRFGAGVTVYSSKMPPRAEELRDADIIVSGIGKPHFITPDMVKDGAILLDAGTSEAEGKMVGDAHPDTAAKCALFTPVPGGIGPVTVAVLFQNLVALEGSF